jgi:phosphoadenosine phosphosulfate reductase
VIDPITCVSAFTIARVARELEHAPAEEILAWALEAYADNVALACSFGGPTGIVAIDMAMRIDRFTPVYYLDTGLLFAETHGLVESIRQRYGIEPVAIQPHLSLAAQVDRYGEALWTRNPDLCCKLRKIYPQQGFLRKYDAWISGIRRDQTKARSLVPVVTWDDQFGLIKVSPFARWTEEMVWEYVRAHNLPYNELHDRGYPSVGCIPCTRAIRSGEGMRDGRWAGSGKVECGLHTSLLIPVSAP